MNQLGGPRGAWCLPSPMQAENQGSEMLCVPSSCQIRDSGSSAHLAQTQVLSLDTWQLCLAGWVPSSHGCSQRHHPCRSVGLCSQHPPTWGSPHFETDEMAILRLHNMPSPRDGKSLSIISGLLLFCKYSPFVAVSLALSVADITNLSLHTMQLPSPRNPVPGSSSGHLELGLDT